MWTKFADWVLRYRIWVIAFVLVITGVLSFFAKDIELSYDFKKLIPASDPDNVYYENFKKNFGEDGSVMVIGISADNLFEEKLFTNWCKLTDDISAIDGVKRVLSFKTMVNIVKDTNTQQFTLDTLYKKRPENQQEVNSLRDEILNLPFYKQLVYSKDAKATLMAIT